MIISFAKFYVFVIIDDMILINDLNIFSDSLMTFHIKDNSIKREKWKHKSEYLFACIGYAVGLGNIWRYILHWSFLYVHFIN